MVIYMSGSTPYNDVEVMCSEQSAGSICMEGAVRTEAAASDAKAVGGTPRYEPSHDHRFGDLPE